jgi:hypothetical protein
MDWYYASNGQQSGPVSEAQLDELARTGGIAPTTLVWRQGMTNWQPYTAARPAAQRLPPPPFNSGVPAPDQRVCVECGRIFSANDVLRYENVYVCGACKPMFFQKLREGITPGTHVWRSGKFLVMNKDAELPHLCVKCNAPGHGRKLKRRLFWHNPWIYLLIPAGLLIYAVIATVIGKRAQIEVSLCQKHWRIRLRDLFITWLLIVGCLGAFAYAIVESNFWHMFGGLGLLFMGAIYGHIRTTMVTPKRIDNKLVWLKGVSADYLAQFPEFTGGR